MKRLLTIFTTLLILSACGREEGSILVTSKQNDISRLYSLSGNGQLSPILKNEQKIADPVLSPDRSMLAFMSEDTGNWNIHIYNLDTREEWRVTSGSSIESFPAWAPDQSRIAYMANRKNNRDIYISELDGSAEKRITISEEIDSEPLWSPSQKDRVYFKSIRSGYEGLYYKNFDEDSIHEVAPVGGAIKLIKAVPHMPQVSYVYQSAKQNNFMVFDEDDATNYSLLETPNRISGYAWSHGGGRLAISIQGQVELYRYSDSKGLRFEFAIPGAAFPQWSVGDERLYYNKRIDGVLQVFAMNLETRKETRHSNSEQDLKDIRVY